MGSKRRGRPPLYETPEQLQERVDAYFDLCDGELLTDEDGNVVFDRKGRLIYINQKPPTMAGLSRYCGFTERHAFTRQKYRSDEFFDVVALARLRIEEHLESCVCDPESSKGAMFLLKNQFGWGERKKNDPGAVVYVIEKAPDDDDDAAAAVGEYSAFRAGASMKLFD